jgi:hypothetical protein
MERIRNSASAYGLRAFPFSSPFKSFSRPRCAESSPKTTRPLVGRFLIAVAQSVGAGCCAGGTSSSQMRHIPAGGMYPFGSASF